MQAPSLISTETKPISRLVSLDVFRGIIIAGMILVTDPGTYDAVYKQLRHAEWVGATATDMIFPSFLFMAGLSIALSFTSRLAHGANKSELALHIVYRSIILFLLGLAVNGFPDYNWHLLRLPGILQRIAICYLCCGLFYLQLKDFKQGKGSGRPKGNLLILGGTAFGLLVIYWVMLVLVPVPGIGAGHLDTYGSLPAYIDRSIMGINHMWAYGLTPGKGVTYDPEGILSTLPAIASTLIGLMVGDWWLETTADEGKKISRLSVAGIVLIIVALLLGFILPINKRIWTSSFALLSSGVAMLLFAFLYILIDLKGWRKWTFPFRVLGTNAILAFVVSSIITTLFDRIKVHGATGKQLTLHQQGNQVSLFSGLSPINASLVYAIVIVVINILILVPLYRRRIFLKV